MNGELADGWNASAGYAYSVSRDQDDERIVTNIPRHSLKTLHQLPPAWRLESPGPSVAGCIGRARLARTRIPSSKVGYALVNVMARFAVTNQLDVAVNVNNLFDRTYLQLRR